MRRPICLLAVFCLACSASSARAEIEYHFVPYMAGQPSGNAQFVSVAPVTGPQGFNVTLSGAMVGSAPSAAPASAMAYLDKWGLGVLNPSAGSDKGVQGQVQLDGQNGGEYLRFEYPEAVTITYLTFSSVGIADRFDLVADGQALNMKDYFPNQTTIREISKAQGLWPGKVDFTSAAQPLQFAKVWDVVIYAGASTGDGVQLENIGVEVPEPSTLLLSLLGVAAIGLVAIRRRGGELRR